jgi:peptidoglycan/LPS O-acetylase OafA/YrhL
LAISVHNSRVITAERNQSLDILRCVAVLLVLGIHVPHYRLWARVGWTGVDLFFVLSGFLISGLLFRDYQEHGSIDWKRFLIRRGFKIYPSYYMFLWIAAILLVLIGHHYNMRSMLLGNAVFVGNYFQQTVTIGPFWHLWSIAVEEHFYVLLPVLLVFLSKRRTLNPFTTIPWLFVVVAGACLALRAFTLRSDQSAYMTHLRMDSLFAGVTLGYVYHFHREWFGRLASSWTLVAAGALCLPVLIADPNSHIVRTVGVDEYLPWIRAAARMVG